MATHISFDDGHTYIVVKEEPDEVAEQWHLRAVDGIPHLWLTRNNNGVEVWVNPNNINFIQDNET